MKITSKIHISAFCFLFLSLAILNPSKSFSYGYEIGAQFNVINDIFPTPLPDHLFVGADFFGNHYKNNIINYNYGAKGKLGYDMAGVQVFGLYGVQHSGFNNHNEVNYKEDTSPIYGFGIGYNFPVLVGIRLSQTYFRLKRIDNSRENFSFTDLALVVVF